MRSFALDCLQTGGAPAERPIPIPIPAGFRRAFHPLESAALGFLRRPSVFVGFTRFPRAAPWSANIGNSRATALARNGSRAVSFITNAPIECLRQHRRETLETLICGLITHRSTTLRGESLLWNPIAERKRKREGRLQGIPREKNPSFLTRAFERTSGSDV